MLRNIILTILIIVTIFVLYLGFNGTLSFNDLITSILTAISSLILLVTLFEIKNQREVVYKPDIVLKSTGTFYMYSEKKSGTFLPSLWSIEEVDTDRYKPARVYFPSIRAQGGENRDPKTFGIAQTDPDRNKIGIPVYNIGKGAAKNIEIKWIYETEEDIIRLFHEDQIDKFKHLPHLKTPFDFLSDLNMEETKDYIVPSKIGSEESIENVFLPYNFQEYFNIYVSCLDIKSIDSSLFLQNIPELFLNISYYDLANDKHHKTFRVNFEIKSHDVWPEDSLISYIDNVKVEFNIKENTNKMTIVDKIKNIPFLKK